ncbi:MAG TPA: prolyl oligopeptidase family serine peptidase [Puia sp.]|nr:prolyl oligopeptidase family serine peptidase [Puia sp.]
MKKFSRAGYALLFCLLGYGSLAQNSSGISYPSARKVDQADDYHGTKVEDPYRWLENDTSADTRAWVQEENKITFSYLNKIPYRDQLKKRIQELYNYPRYSRPFRNGSYFYFYKNNGLQNQAVLYRQKGLDGQPELVIDPNGLSADGTTSLRNFTLSKDGHYAAYSLSKGGSDWETFYVRDMLTGKDLGDTLNWVKFSGAAWQGNGFYYNRFPQPSAGHELSSKNEHEKIYFHTVGTGQDQDRLVYEDPANPEQLFGVGTSEDEQYAFLFIEDPAKGTDGNSLWYLPSPDAKKFQPIVAEVGKYRYNVIDNVGNKFLLQTNDGAPNSKIVLIDPATPDRESWKTIVPEMPEPIDEAGTAGGRLYITYLKDVSTHAYEYDLQGKLQKEIKLPGLGTAAGFSGLKDDQYLFYSFTSLTFPSTIYRYEIATGTTQLFRKPEIAFTPEDYETRQVFYPSKDGTKIPMFIVFKKGLKLDGSHPTLLYAYGGFNISSLPNFSATLVPWLEQGGVYALANLRGGAEYGEKWHEAGMRFKKQNVFDDFVAAAEYLEKNKYTSSQKLAIRGGSNGGLLIGAVVNQHPELFKVAIAQVGVMDMLRFHKFTIGAAWISEYGSSDSASDFKNLYSYSPLHNIRSGLNYPAVLITTADHDDRVVPAHSFKYAATMQEKYKGPNPILIRIDTNSGHGSSNTSKIIETMADIYAFAFFNMGFTPVFDHHGSESKKAF